VYSSSCQQCVACGSQLTARILAGLAFTALFVLCFLQVVFAERKSCSTIRGSIKILFTTCQIVSTISWTVDMKLPGPLYSAAITLEALQIDPPWGCFVTHSGYPFVVYLTSALPIVCAVAIWLAYAIRRWACVSSNTGIVRRVSFLTGIVRSRAHTSGQFSVAEAESARQSQLLSQHSAATLFLVCVLSLVRCDAKGQFIVASQVPRAAHRVHHSVPRPRMRDPGEHEVGSTFLFFAWALTARRSGGSYLRADTHVSCDDASYQRFAYVDGLLIALYQASLLTSAYLLYSHRARLNPPSIKDAQLRELARARDQSLNPLSFLFEDYRCEAYMFEVVDM
jgi:hypothetical protein